MLELLQPQTKKSNLEEHNNSLIKLHSLLYKKLFLNDIKSANTKEQLEFYIKPKDKYEALHDKFIWFGSNKATSFIIIDIDYINTPIEQYRDEVIYKLGIEPNWITRTSKGYHIGFILDSTIWLDNSIAKEKLIETKKNLTDLLKGDLAGSLKTNGFWRNPLTHKSIINTKDTYSIEELFKASTHQIKSSTPLFDTVEKNTTKLSSSTLKKENLLKINIDKIQKQGFTQGNRNNFLFSKTVSMLYKSQITNNQVLSTLTELNNGELPTEEIKRTAKSIMKYNIKPNSINNKSYKPGEYYQALWENKIHNYKKENKIEFSRQKFGQSSSVAKKIKNTTLKLVQAYTEIYQKNLSFTNKNISKLSGVSIRTVQIYRNRRKLEDQIKIVAFKEFLKSLKEGIDSEKGVKAKFTPLSKELINLINLAISEVEFIYSKTEEVYKFSYKDDSMIFYRENEEMVA